MYSTFPSFCRQPPDAPQRSLSHATPQLVGLPPIARGSGLRHSPAGSPTRPAVSRSSLSYGPMVHLRLLPTPPRGDAVTFSYRPESAGLEGTRTPLIEYTFRRTRADALIGPQFVGERIQQKQTPIKPPAGGLPCGRCYIQAAVPSRWRARETPLRRVAQAAQSLRATSTAEAASAA